MKTYIKFSKPTGNILIENGIDARYNTVSLDDLKIILINGTIVEFDKRDLFDIRAEVVFTVNIIIKFDHTQFIVRFDFSIDRDTGDYKVRNIHDSNECTGFILRFEPLDCIPQPGQISNISKNIENQTKLSFFDWKSFGILMAIINLIMIILTFMRE